jgi:hypothetical protein
MLSMAQTPPWRHVTAAARNRPNAHLGGLVALLHESIHVETFDSARELLGAASAALEHLETEHANTED